MQILSSQPHVFMVTLCSLQSQGFSQSRMWHQSDAFSKTVLEHDSVCVTNCSKGIQYFCQQHVCVQTYIALMVITTKSKMNPEQRCLKHDHKTQLLEWMKYYASKSALQSKMTFSQTIFKKTQLSALHSGLCSGRPYYQENKF